MIRAWAATCAVAVVLIAGGCVTQPELPSVPVTTPAGFDAVAKMYLAAADRGESVYRVDAGESVVHILVYRDGALARLGHDHAVTGRQIYGFAWLPANGAARADVYLHIAELIVDNPAARKAAGLTSEPTAADRDGTYRNMLASFDADQYPSVLLHVTVPMAEPLGTDQPRIASVDLTLHGTMRRLTVPVQVALHDDQFRATGSFKIRQTDFGITPFSVFGGVLAVRDELELRFDLNFSRF